MTEEKNISIIGYHGTFSKMSSRYGGRRGIEDFQTQRQLAKIINLQFHEKQICVSKKECIKDILLVYNGEDVVI